MDLIRNNVEEVFSTVKIFSEILTKICRYAQYFLICLFYFLLLSLSYLYIHTSVSINFSPLEIALSLVVGVFTMFSMVFNYTMCVIVKPGSPKDIQYNLIAQIDQRCRKCSVIKPPRTHHCSMCNACILQMDHHCPWIGQCVGHHNRSFFMNFLFYTEVGLLLESFILKRYMSNAQYWKQVELEAFSPMLIMETYYFIVTLIVVLGLFNLFHWYLILAGKTTLECCLSDPRYTPSNKCLFNLKIVFGTLNPLMIFLPKFSVLQHKGYNWETNSHSNSTSMVQIQQNDLSRSSSKRINISK